MQTPISKLLYRGAKRQKRVLQPEQRKLRLRYEPGVYVSSHHSIFPYTTSKKVLIEDPKGKHIEVLPDFIRCQETGAPLPRDALVRVEWRVRSCYWCDPYESPSYSARITKEEWARLVGEVFEIGDVYDPRAISKENVPLNFDLYGNFADAYTVVSRDDLKFHNQDYWSADSVNRNSVKICTTGGTQYELPANFWYYMKNPNTASLRYWWVPTQDVLNILWGRDAILVASASEPSHCVMEGWIELVHKDGRAYSATTGMATNVETVLVQDAMFRDRLVNLYDHNNPEPVRCVTDLDRNEQLRYISNLPQLIARARIIVDLAKALTNDPRDVAVALSEFVGKVGSNKLQMRDNNDSTTVQFASLVVDRQLRPRQALVI